MAYDPASLSALTYANGFTLWHYRTPDSLADVLEPGYFDKAANMLRTGDFILVNTSIDADSMPSTLLSVAYNEHGSVTIAAWALP